MNLVAPKAIKMNPQDIKLNVNGLHLYSAVPTYWPPKAHHNIASHSPFTHTFTHQGWREPCKATASLSGADRVRCLDQGHHIKD